jgi:hypothetical protein
MWVTPGEAAVASPLRALRDPEIALQTILKGWTQRPY